VHGGNKEKYKTFKTLADKEKMDVITCKNVNEGMVAYLKQRQKGGLGN
jgi:hypothetical protein